MITSQSINQFLQGKLINDYIYAGTLFMSGDTNRYWRAKETGEYFQDKFQFRSNIAITAGIRFDWNGALTEKNGNLLNFDPSKYAYDPATDTITSTGLIVAGNSPHGTPGVSNSTLTGRQWGFAPRIGLAWSPKMFNDKLVVRAGWGLYYDRGELFAYLSPGFASGVITGGPFGVNQTPPWVSSQTCDPEGFGYVTCPDLANPWGPTLGSPPSGNPKDLNLPNAAVSSTGLPLFSFADYNRANKLPYTMNQTLDIQWQPRNDLVIQIGYVGNLGRHEVVPIPFNQAQIASPAHPIRPGTPFEQDYTYGYSILSDPSTFTPATLPNGQPYLQTFEGGNVNLRVPYT